MRTSNLLIFLIFMTGHIQIHVQMKPQILLLYWSVSNEHTNQTECQMPSNKYQYTSILSMERTFFTAFFSSWSVRRFSLFILIFKYGFRADDSMKRMIFQDNHLMCPSKVSSKKKKKTDLVRARTRANVYFHCVGKDLLWIRNWCFRHRD